MGAARLRAGGPSLFARTVVTPLKSTLTHPSRHVLAVANSSSGILPRLGNIVVASPQTMPDWRPIRQKAGRRRKNGGQKRDGAA
jgi:hypothetical protein